jgi:hypothetical protein
MTKRARPAGAVRSAVERSHARKRRPRPTPKWLLQAADLDQVAKSRCVLILRVLAGELPVTEASQTAAISRGTYYQLETRALHAMLRALTPALGSDESEPAATPVQRLAQLEAKVKRLEQEKRRTERLLLLTRKVLKSPLHLRRRRRRPPTETAPASTPSGGRPSPGSRSRPRPLTSASTPTPAGGGGS